VNREYFENQIAAMTTRLESTEMLAQILGGQLQRQRRDLALLAAFAEVGDYATRKVRVVAANGTETK